MKENMILEAYTEQRLQLVMNWYLKDMESSFWGSQNVKDPHSMHNFCSGHSFIVLGFANEDDFKAGNLHVIGMVTIKDVDDISRNCVVGVLLDNSFRKKGMSVHVIDKLVDYCFYKLNMFRLSCHIISTNEASLKAAKKVGFVQEGTLRKQSFHNGKFEDVHIFGILKSDYKKR